MKILFIGNSYTYYNDLPVIFQELARANGKDVTATAVTKGARKLIAYKDSNDPITQKLENALVEDYDVCVIQEQSVLPITDPGLFAEGLTQVTEMVKCHADRIIFYATWGRKAGSNVLEKHGWTTAQMTDLLTQSYGKAAADFGAELSPVGKNFLAVSQALPEVDLYDPDLSHPSYAGSCLSVLTHYWTVFKEFPENTDTLKLENAVIAAFKKVICQ